MTRKQTNQEKIEEVLYHGLQRIYDTEYHEFPFYADAEIIEQTLSMHPRLMTRINEEAYSENNIISDALSACINTESTAPLDVLIKHNADINKTDKNGDTPFHIAVQTINEYAFQSLLPYYIDKIDQKGAGGNTALHKATIGDKDNNILDKNLIKLLLNLGADPDLTNDAFKKPDAWLEKSDIQFKIYLSSLSEPDGSSNDYASAENSIPEYVKDIQAMFAEARERKVANNNVATTAAEFEVKGRSPAGKSQGAIKGEGT